ncbi:tetratricopeptide repeat protein, partial [Thermogemmatispora tikiterensis]|uniref:tetratricopeptide repeat protein n=1 Tax=Thermogemmatispora tikiterensis TaxID=1825093 RepID=UPI001674E91C
METTAPVLVFCSWSRSPADRSWFDRVLTALQPLEAEGLISLWHDDLVPGGSDLGQERAHAFARASVVLLIFSPDYLASEQGHSELQQARQRRLADEIRLIPVLLRACDWEQPLGLDLKPLPADRRPIASRYDSDEGLRQLTSGLRQALSDRSASLVSHSSEPALPLWNVPFAPSPCFTGREDELAALDAFLQQRSPAIGQALAISGLSGVGKTRLAVEYAFRFRSAYRAVLWVDATSQETLLASYRELASLLSLPGRHEQELLWVVLAVRRWLQTQPGYLLILDHLNEPALLFSSRPDWPPVLGSPFLPPNVAGHLLITTCAADLGSLGLGLPQPLALSCFSPEQGALLLLRRAGRLPPDASLEQAAPRERQEALLLSEELGGLPLALDQAGAYLAATGDSCAAYRQLLQQRRLELLRLRSGHRDPQGSDHPTPVATTWDLSCSRVRKRHPEAVDLLHFCAFLAPDPIPEALLAAGLARLAHPLAATVANRFTLNATIEALRAYSLLSRDPSSGSLQLHRLLQVVLRSSLPPQEQRDWKELVIEALVQAFLGKALEHWPLREQLLPHALQAAIWIEAEPSLQTPSAAALLNEVSRTLRVQGRSEEALPLAQRSLSLSEQTLGPGHLATGASLHTLAALYRDLG